MGLFDHFPYTNFHELNLMWILEALKEIQTTTEQFVAINSLKYADPIQWNITNQYEKNTIVIDPQTGTAYISVQPVPVGVALTNTDYWSVVFNLEQFVTKANNNFTLKVEEQTTLTATFPIDKDDWVVWGGELYEALVNIVAGDQYVPDSNIKRITVEEIKDRLYDAIQDEFDNLADDLADEVTARTDADDTLRDAIGDEVTARTNADTDIIKIINNRTVVSVKDFGAVGDGITDDTQAFQDAIDSGNDVYIPMASLEKYIISSTLHIDTYRQAIFSDPILRGLDNYQRGHIYSTTSPIFTTDKMGVIFKDLALVGSGSNIAIVCNATDISDNADPRIEGTCFYDFNCCVRNYGRGLFFNDNAAIGCSCVVRNSYSFDGTGGTDLQQPDTGDRAMRIINNRAHGVDVLVDNVAGILNGAIITDNMLDIGGTLFTMSDGGLKNSIISNNVINYGSRTVINIGGTGTICDYNIITNNTMIGMTGRYPTRALYVGDNVSSFSHNIFKGNIIHMTNSEAFLVVPASSDNVFNDNIFSDIGQNDNVLCAVRFARAVTNTQICNNRFSIKSTAKTSNIRITNSVSNSVITDNIIDTSIPLIAGYTQGSPVSIIDGYQTIADAATVAADPTQADFNSLVTSYNGLLAALRNMNVIS